MAIPDEVIKAGNSLIGAFLEKEGPFLYHLSWHRLMMAVEKVESLKTEEDGHFGVYISSNCCVIHGTHLRTDQGTDSRKFYFDEVVRETKRESTWFAIANFVKWWNVRNETIGDPRHQ